MDAAVSKLIKDNREFLEVDETAGQVVCKLSGHRMKISHDIVVQYIGGKKFAKLKSRQADLDSLKQYEPHIVPSKHQPSKLFCRLTGLLIEKKESAIVRHSDGKRFQTELIRVAAGAALKEEPSPEFLQKIAEQRAEAAQSTARGSARASAHGSARGSAQASASKAAGDGGAEKDDDDDDDDGPAMWVPPQHIIDSDDGGGDSDEDVRDADMSDDEAALAAAIAAGGGARSGSGGGRQSEEEEEEALVEVRMPRGRAKKRVAKGAAGPAAVKGSEKAASGTANDGGAKKKRRRAE